MVTCRSIVGLMLLLDLAMASRVEASPDIVPHGGSWALEFQVQPISGSSQYGIATKYHLTEHSAARLGFLVTVGSGDSETSFKADQTDIYGTTTTT